MATAGSAEDELRTWLAAEFDLSLAAYLDQLIAQKGCCASCLAEDQGGMLPGFIVDRDPRSTRVRGLLCGRCAALIETVEGDGNRVQSVQRYLKKQDQTLREPAGDWVPPRFPEALGF